jgi:hypothetical protein
VAAQLRLSLAASQNGLLGCRGDVPIRGMKVQQQQKA